MRVLRSADDFKTAVGQELGVSDWLEVTQERINQFADATDDHQWIHVDPERAVDGPFGTTIAHGWLTASLLPTLVQQIVKVDSKMGVNYGLNRLRFPAPVPVGACVRARSVLKEVTEVNGAVQVMLNTTVEVKGSKKPALVAETLARYYW